MTKNAYFSLLTHTKQLLLVTFCAGIGIVTKRDGMPSRGQTDARGQTDVNNEMVM